MFSIRVLRALRPLLVGLFIAAYFSVGEAQEPPGTAQQQWNKSADLGRLGLINLRAQSRYTVPNILEQASPAVGNLEFEVSHTLSSGYRFAPLSIQVEGTSADLSKLKAGENNLGQIRIEFSGLLLNGLPQYLQAKAADYFHEHKIKFDQDPASTSHATLTRVLSVNIDQETYANITTQLDMLNVLMQENDQSSTRQIDFEETQKKIAATKERLAAELKRISKLDLNFFPTITKVIKFPIFEKGAESSTSSNDSSNDASSASASAKIGVSGDVMIRITPRCSISIGSASNLDTAVEVDVVVQSHGYFGARAEASASAQIDCAFQSPALGDYHLPSDLVGKKEVEILSHLILDSMITARDAKSLNEAIIGAVKKSDLVADLKQMILEDLIGTKESPAPIEKLRQIFDSLGGCPGSEADMVCRYASATEPIMPVLKIPTFVDPLLPPMPIKPDGLCLPEIPVPTCRVEEVRVPQPDHPCTVRKRVTVLRPCPTVDNPFKMCPHIVIVEIPSYCPTPPLIVKEWLPPGCLVTVAEVEESNRLIRETCKAIDNWQTQFTNWQTTVNNIQAEALRKHDQLVEQVRADFESRMNQFIVDRNNFLKYRSNDIIYKTALEFANSNILLPEISDSLASDIVNKAWTAVDNDPIDYISGLVREKFSRFLTVQAKGSARLAFDSTAHFLELTPRLEQSLSYGVNPVKKKVELRGTARFFEHADANNQTKQGRIGGLDVMGMVLSLENTVSFAGRRQTFNYEKHVFDTETLAFPINIKKEPFEKTFTIDLTNPISTK